MKERPARVAAPMKTMARLRSIVYQPRGRYGDGFDSFVRVALEAATLIAGHGIEGDEKAGRNPRRQLNLLSFEWLTERRGEGYKTNPGDFGEQLVVEGLAVESLRRGDRLRAGDEARIEITMPRTGCVRLQAAQGMTNELLRGHIGVLAKVVNCGVIRVGDAVELLPHADAETTAGRLRNR